MHSNRSSCGYIYFFAFTRKDPQRRWKRNPATLSGYTQGRKEDDTRQGGSGKKTRPHRPHFGSFFWSRWILHRSWDSSFRFDASDVFKISSYNLSNNRYLYWKVFWIIFGFFLKRFLEIYFIFIMKELVLSNTTLRPYSEVICAPKLTIFSSFEELTYRMLRKKFLSNLGRLWLEWHFFFKTIFSQVMNFWKLVTSTSINLAGTHRNSSTIDDDYFQKCFPSHLPYLDSASNHKSHSQSFTTFFPLS